MVARLNFRKCRIFPAIFCTKRPSVSPESAACPESRSRISSWPLGLIRISAADTRTENLEIYQVKNKNIEIYSQTKISHLAAWPGLSRRSLMHL